MMASWISRIEQAPRLQNSDMMRNSSVLSFGSDTVLPFYYRWGPVYDTCSRRCKWAVATPGRVEYPGKGAGWPAFGTRWRAVGSAFVQPYGCNVALTALVRPGVDMHTGKHLARWSATAVA